MGAHETRTFMSGDGVALRLPDGLAIGPDEKMIVERNGDVLTIRFARDPAEAKRRMEAAYEAMLAIGAPEDGVQARAPFDFPERPELL